MKIGILTFQESINFGAQLQCFAMQEFLKQMGHEPEVIQFVNYKPTPFYRGINIKKNGIIKAFKIMLLRLIYDSKMRWRFLKFKNQHLQLSPICTIANIANIANKYDAIITGSDQIWGWSGHHHATFFVGWEPQYTGIRISYCPDCAKNYIQKKDQQKVAELLNRYDHLSVRNKETYDFVNGLTGKEPPVVVDPTFLINFDSYIDQRIAPYKQYIVTYILGSEIDGGHKKIIQNIRKQFGEEIPVIAIVLTENQPQLCAWANKVYYCANPMEWLNLFYYASFIYTDSFHGLVFALKFKKRFIAYYNEEARAARFIDLSKRYNIDRCIVTDLKDALIKQSFSYEPDYKTILPRIQQDINFSVEFIKKVTKKNSNEI